MKIRFANKIMKHQPENDPIGRKFNPYWVKRWNGYEGDFFPQKEDHRIVGAISLTTKNYNRKLNKKKS